MQGNHSTQANMQHMQTCSRPHSATMQQLPQQLTLGQKEHATRWTNSHMQHAGQTHAQMQHTWDPLTQSAFGQQELQSHDATMTADHSHSVGQHVTADGLIQITCTHEKPAKHSETMQWTHVLTANQTSTWTALKRNSHMQ
ncbi:hypothetical protein I3842_03G158500 [Carya illinoinensis]|uniref:Uncharacterized protein n=1 Tax=Carya illinoinensis TaxID=32201 RepID=A0A922FLE9_CARIL|nr:hypothetical protein I3842_03G158500 [Carya illinoinensis]